MIRRINPLTIMVRHNDDAKSDPPWELFIEDPKKVTSFTYRRQDNKLFIYFENKWYQVSDPDYKEFISIFRHLSPYKKQNRFKRTINTIKSWLQY